MNYWHGCLGLHWLVLIALLMTGCSLPPITDRTESYILSVEDARLTRLGAAVKDRNDSNPELTGIYTLNGPRDAFAARALLARVAEKTLDVQYYIWKGDITGTLLLEEIHAAADRGVRVRLLLDDNGTYGLDKDLSVLNLHPNIEVRLFNPFTNRSFKSVGFITDFDRLNRRMHNKSFTVDNTATIIGGRNVGDEYFGATDGLLFDDLDVMAIGEVVDSVSKDFDRYWHSLSAYPIESLVSRPPQYTLDELHSAAKAVERLPGAADYVKAIRELPFVQKLLNDELPLIWARTQMISDSPNKALGLAEKEDLLITRLAEFGGQAEQELFLVSPYFVPTKEGVKVFKTLIDNNVDVRVLTNSLDATDVIPVHAGYAKRRKALLKYGVKIFEMQRTAPKGNLDLKDLLGSSGSSLHAKTFALDRKRVFIGSFNFDPRSANLNTELGFLIESPKLANDVVNVFQHELYKRSYEVVLNQEGKLQWQEHRGNEIKLYFNEPRTPWYKRAFVKFCSWLPIEPLL